MNPFLNKSKNQFNFQSIKLGNYSITLMLLLVLLGFVFSCSSDVLDEKEKEEYTKEGAKIVSEAHGYLNAHLYQFLNDSDIKSAILGACKLNGVPQLDSIVQLKNIRIRRVSNLNRNPENKASKFESEILKNYENQPNTKDKTILEVVNKKPVYFSPIYVNETCLKCHGEQGKTLDSAGYETTNLLYPEDKAIGYKNGDLIGMWTVTFLEDF